MTSRRRPKPKNTSIAVALVRASTDEQHLGPAAQREAIARWAASQGVQVASWYEDLGVSGAAPIEDRPGLLAALVALEVYGAGLLVVSRRDRLARDLGARIVAVDSPLNGDAPEARLMRTILDSFAEYERSLIRARIRAALAVKKARRERVGAVPYGYRLAQDGVHLEEEVAEQQVVEEVISLRARGGSYPSICRTLAEQGLQPRSGGRWYPIQVARIVGRRVEEQQG
jgi:site-specific DNA recombinase